MTSIDVLRECVVPRTGGHWLAYLVPMGFYGLLAAMGAHEGLANASVFLTLVAICGLQLWKETLLGWAMVFVPMAGYVFLLIGNVAKLAPTEFLAFSAPGAVAALTLWLWRPRATRGATIAALAVVGIPLAAFALVVFS